MTEKASGGEPRYRRLPRFWHGVFLVLTTIGILLIIHQMFLLGRFTGINMVENSYLYILLATFLSPVFILIPANRRAGGGIRWYDVALFVVNIAVCTFLAWNGLTIRLSAYEFFAPIQFTALSVVLWLLVLEGGRRTGGLALCIVVLVFSLFPLYARYLPGPLSGFSLNIGETARFHAMATDGIIGTSMRVVGDMIIGFIIMGVVLVVTGGGTFFMNLASAMMGTRRGGAAKVSIMASALFGTMSGSVVSNVITSGSVTIPAMRRAGYPPTYAAAIEACASTGGIIMPPVMGATAFIMASVLGIPYAQIAIAAAIPSVLYYFGLLLQADCFAARTGLRGVPREDLPSVWKTLREGWYYVVSAALLIFLLLYLKQEVLAPFYATALLLVLTNVRKETRMSFAKLKEMMAMSGRMLVELVGIMAAVGLIVGSLSITGVTPTLASLLVHIAGGDTFLLLVMGALASLILGTGMTIIAVYVLVAVVLAPALVTIGLNPLAAHLFIMYWGAVSFITPPVAVGAYTAAAIANSSPMQTAFVATRLGGVIYVIPFFFVLDPVLVLQEVTPVSLVLALFGATAATFLIACGLQGYIIGVGTMKLGATGWLMRALLCVGGILMGLPGWTKLAGLLLTAPIVVGHLVAHRLKMRSLSIPTGLHSGG